MPRVIPRKTDYKLHYRRTQPIEKWELMIEEAKKEARKLVTEEVTERVTEEVTGRMIKSLIETCMELGVSKEHTTNRLIEKAGISPEAA